MSCPHCGYCPHCGRSNARPYGLWPWPYAPYGTWPQWPSWWSQTSGGGKYTLTSAPIQTTSGSYAS